MNGPGASVSPIATANAPVTADTHFRAGSISKTFVAAAMVQLYLDGDIDLDTPIAEIAPELRIDNAWEPADPVRVIHLLQHTAGFDDMHFNEIYSRPRCGGAVARERAARSIRPREWCAGGPARACRTRIPATPSPAI